MLLISGGCIRPIHTEQKRKQKRKLSLMFTARKRSLGQGNIFTPVCHSVHGRGVVSQHALQVVSQHALQWGGAWSRGGAWSGGSAPRGMSAPGGCLVETPRTASAAGGTHPTGMHSCCSYFCLYCLSFYFFAFARTFAWYKYALSDMVFGIRIWIKP